MSKLSGRGEYLLFSSCPLSCSKSDPGLLVRVIPILNYMLEDDSTVVIKRVLASVIQIYKLALLVNEL